jgi:PEP-CTERM motif
VKLKSLVAGAAVALFASTAVQANNVNQDIAVVGGTTPYGTVHTDNLPFIDTITFNVAGSVLANLSLVTVGSGPANIDFLTASLNGQALTLSPTGFFETGFLNDTILNGPLVLTVTGNSFSNGSTFASYSGTLNVTPVPEPQAYVLAFAGLAALGWARRQRRKS